MKESDTRFTPQHVLNVVREFAPIGLDPCTVESNPVEARHVMYLPRFDGLDCSWQAYYEPGFVHFVNPPYSRGQIIRWATKGATEFRFGGVESIHLVPADTSTKATQFYLANANVVAFWKKRICFAGEAGAKFANALFYFGGRVDRFVEVFSPRATCLRLKP